MSRRFPLLALALALTLPGQTWAAAGPEDGQAAVPAQDSRNGQEIYRRFREGLSDPSCPPATSSRWKAHFAKAPQRLASREGDVLPLFGYVVDAVREAHLPSEYALIPFVESGYRPGARSPQGPAGLWQLIAVTARHHKVPMRPGYDGRLSPVESTAAAVRYLKTLHGMFAGDWRLAVMAYNAGEYRVFGALKRAGQQARNANPESLPGLSPITHAYVRKLKALSCLMQQAAEGQEWTRALDREVPRLQAVEVPAGVRDLADWARSNGQDPDRLRRLNPAFENGRLPGTPVKLLASASLSSSLTTGSAEGAIDSTPVASVAVIADSLPAGTPDTLAPIDGTATAPVAKAGPAPAANLRQHVVAQGENATRIAARYGIRLAELLRRNGLTARSVLKPGAVLLIDTVAADSTGGTTAR